MSRRKSQNPMQYRVKSASGKVHRCFRKRDSAENYFEQVKVDFPNEVIVFEDIFANTIIKNHCPKEATATSGYISTEKVPAFTSSNTKTNAPNNVIFEYKDGHLIRKEVNGKSRKTFIGFLKSLFKKEK